MTERFQHISRIADLITAELTGTITRVQREELDQWKTESPEHLSLYHQYRSEDFIARKFELVRENNLNEAYGKFVERTRLATRRRRRLVFYRYAGIIALLFVLGGTYYLGQEHEESSLPVVQGIQPGTCKAILTQPDGEKVDISNTSYLTYVEKKSPVMAAKSDEQLEGDTCRYYTITIPRGGEYTLTLNDGSVLKMNSESEIRIPEVFDKKQRNVFMSGEIYFDVVRDTTAPFVVHTRQGDVRVLGTSFNIRDYQEEAFLEATLVSGKIVFNREEKNTFLNPSEQLRFNKEDGTTTLEVVDTRLYCSWKEGRFVFEKERLENIMSTLSRWYDIHVAYENEAAKDILFTGNIKRYGDLNQVIDMLKLVNKIDIKIKGNHVSIKSE